VMQKINGENMKEMKKKINLVKSLVLIFVALSILLTVYGLDAFWIGLLNEWFPVLLTSVILTAVATGIVEAFTGDFLKNKLIPIEIFGFKFSVPVFFITVIIVKFFILK